ncbi:hypothetical protein [Corynebacterium kozikiae]|uniref:hypothetical protein n=1 Tax=Corynebacterium kozikiae TaxID=2968469 RepID=UPI00211C1784|nr:hypothetical protein [Corynebacterium sp. 76QC2CO]MCQ9343931.1 hypothetical protein [Corynebacterium sp. 76QC2CO]
MAITLKQAIDAAVACVGGIERLEGFIKYGPLTEGYARMYEFEKKPLMKTPGLGDVHVVLIDERTGKNMASSSFPGIAEGDYEVIDFDGNVIRSREEVQAAWEAEEKRQAELEAQAEAEEDETLEVVPVEWNLP